MVIEFVSYTCSVTEVFDIKRLVVNFSHKSSYKIIILMDLLYYREISCRFSHKSSYKITLLNHPIKSFYNYSYISTLFNLHYASISSSPFTCYLPSTSLLVSQLNASLLDIYPLITYPLNVHLHIMRFLYAITLLYALALAIALPPKYDRGNFRADIDPDRAKETAKNMREYVQSYGPQGMTVKYKDVTRGPEKDVVRNDAIGGKRRPGVWIDEQPPASFRKLGDPYTTRETTGRESRCRPYLPLINLLLSN
jgi:hypothetical protein